MQISPTMFWGPGSPFQYWGELDKSGVFFGKGMGCMFVAVTCSPWYAGISKAALAKVYIVPNIFYMYLFLQCSNLVPAIGVCGEVCDAGPNAMIPGLNLWITQLPIAAVLLLLNLAALGDGDSKTKGA